jgi:hypothetical protein
MINLRHYCQTRSAAAADHWQNFIPAPRAAIPLARVMSK